MQRFLSVLSSALLGLFVLVAVPTAASAELSSTPTTSWGVSGLVTGSRTDTIRSEVWAIEQIGNRLYVGGRFTHVTNGNTAIPQPYLAAFNATTGEYIPGFDPQLNNAVYALEAAPDGSKLFVGGSFNRVEGNYTSALVALDPIDGSLDSWSGRVGGYSLVRNLDLVGADLYASGSFSQVKSSAGTTQASRVGRWNWQTGIHDASWLPNVTGGSVWGIAVSENADRVYLAGYFTAVNGVSATGGFKAVRKSDGENATGVQPFKINTANVSRQYAYDVVTVNGLVFVGGSEHYVQVLNESDLSLRKFHMSQPSRGDYQDLEVVGDRVYAGCHCRLSSYIESADGVLWWGTPPAGESNAPVTDSGPNSWVTAFSATTGDREASFVPDINSTGPGVWAIHGTSNGCVWFGGNITKAAGVTQHNMTRLCDENGGGDTQKPSTPGQPVVGNIGTSSVAMTWAASTDNVGVTGYRVFNNADDSVALDVSGTGGTVTGLAAGTYAYYVKAYDAAGNLSNRSGITTVTVGNQTDTERPSTPGRPQVQQIGPDSVDLSWIGSTDNVGVAGYRVFDNANGSIVLDVPGTSGTVTGLAPGTYSLYTKAYDAAGNVSYRSGFTQVTITGGGNPDTERPSNPKGLAVSGGANSANLTWIASTDNVGVAGYRVFDQATNTVVADVSGTTATLSLAPGTYTFYVKAYDAAGNLSWRSNLKSHTFN